VDAANTYAAYLEVGQDGQWLAVIPDLPGCFGRGATEQAALSALTAAIPSYYAWLQAHDDYTPVVHGPWNVLPRETFHTFLVGDYEVNAFFTPDGEPVDDDELEWGLALLGWAHEDLMRQVGGAPAAVLDAPSLAGGATLRQALDHVAQAQLWYVSRLDAFPVPTAVSQLPGATIERLDRVHAACVDRLRAASDDQRTRLLEHQGERWSLRNVLRRSVWHVRDQTAQIQSILAAQRPAPSP
jgi:predicted RNase H-like HicB family nuclease